MQPDSATSAWGMSESEQALDREGSFSNDKTTPLRLVKTQTAINPRRPPIVASLMERLSYYQFQVNSASKSQFNGSNPHFVFNWMLLALCTNMTLGVLGTYYVEVFLGVFAREQHLCASKMTPLAYGINVLFFFCAIMDLSRFTDLSMTFLDYLFYGLYYRAPWNRCGAIDIPSKTAVIDGKILEFNCLNLYDFREFVLANHSGYKLVRFNEFSCFVVTGYDKCVQIVQTMFIEDRIFTLVHSRLTVMIYAVALWLGCILVHKKIYQKFIWKLIFYTDVFFCAIYFIVSLHVIIFPDDTKKVDFHEEATEAYAMIVWEFVELMSACFVFSPPMVHFLSARCKKVDPGTESLGMALSTVGHTLFFIVTNFNVQNYVFTRLGGISAVTPFSSSYGYMNMDFWLIYFGTMTPGNFFSVVFLFVNFMMEYVSMVLTFSCTIEIYTSEFKYAKRWAVIGVVMIFSFANYMCFTEERAILQFFGRMTVLITESSMIYFFYPLTRLLDDIQFYFGQQVSKMRYFSIMISIFIEIILYIIVIAYIRIEKIVKFIAEKDFHYSAVYTVLISLTAFPLVAGCGWTIFKYLVIKKKDWTLIFVPDDEWGPSEFVPRQLRKQFSSNKFIASQAPRVLSRYLMKNAEPETYKIDIVYDFTSLWRVIEANRNI